MAEAGKLGTLSLLDSARLGVMETFHGIKFPGLLHTQESLELAVKFPFQDTDIIIATYPKSGMIMDYDTCTVLVPRC